MKLIHWFHLLDGSVIRLENYKLIKGTYVSKTSNTEIEIPFHAIAYIEHNIDEKK